MLLIYVFNGSYKLDALCTTTTTTTTTAAATTTTTNLQENSGKKCNDLCFGCCQD